MFTEVTYVLELFDCLRQVSALDMTLMGFLAPKTTSIAKAEPGRMPLPRCGGLTQKAREVHWTWKSGCVTLVTLVYLSEPPSLVICKMEMT